MTEAYPQPSERLPASPVGDDWHRQQEEMARRRPDLVVEEGTVSPAASPLGYRVQVRGRGLWPALSPPRITVGGIEVTDLQFSGDGTALSGMLRRRPAIPHLVVDYGFARAEAELSVRTAWWHWIRPVLLRVWTVLDRIVRRGISLLP